MKRIYLDYAASTPVRKEVLRAMLPYFSEKYGNPGSLHSFGQEAMAAVDDSRAVVARSLNADFREIVFTGSATEANNLALRGIVKQFEIRNSKFETKPKLIVSAIEHESVLDTAHELEREGVDVVVIPVDKRGIVDLKKLEEELDERTVLVSVMYANNEIGTIQPISKIAKILNNFKKEKKSFYSKPPQPSEHGPSFNSSTVARRGQASESLDERSGLREKDFFSSSYPLFHCDAAQAPMYLDCDVRKLGVDLMTLSGQKVYGPKGIGALYVNSKFEIRNLKFLSPEVTGGGQEFGLRSGTENTPAIVGLGKAVDLAVASKKKNAKQVEGVRNYFWKKLKSIYRKAEVNGSPDLPAPCLRMQEAGAPHVLNIYFPGEYAGDLLVKFDVSGIAASAGSACSARAFTPSHVLAALGLPEERVRGSVRFSFGIQTTWKEIDEAIRRIKGVIE